METQAPMLPLGEAEAPPLDGRSPLRPLGGRLCPHLLHGKLCPPASPLGAVPWAAQAGCPLPSLPRPRRDRRRRGSRNGKCIQAEVCGYVLPGPSRPPEPPSFFFYRWGLWQSCVPPSPASLKPPPPPLKPCVIPLPTTTPGGGSGGAGMAGGPGLRVRATGSASSSPPPFTHGGLSAGSFF